MCVCVWLEQTVDHATRLSYSNDINTIIQLQFQNTQSKIKNLPKKCTQNPNFVKALVAVAVVGGVGNIFLRALLQSDAFCWSFSAKKMKKQADKTHTSTYSLVFRKCKTHTHAHTHIHVYTQAVLT